MPGEEDQEQCAEMDADEAWHWQFEIMDVWEGRGLSWKSLGKQRSVPIGDWQGLGQTSAGDADRRRRPVVGYYRPGVMTGSTGALRSKSQCVLRFRSATPSL